MLREKYVKKKCFKLLMEISKRAIRDSDINEWEEDGDIEWGFDETIGRLSKEKGQ